MFVLLLILSLSGTSLATTLEDPENQPGPLHTWYLTNGQSHIFLGTNSITIMGISEANQTVDTIWVRSYLQRWTGSSWVNVDSVYRARNNTDSVLAEKTIPVGSGQYRVKSEHQVIHKGVRDPNPPYISETRTVTMP